MRGTVTRKQLTTCSAGELRTWPVGEAGASVHFDFGRQLLRRVSLCVPAAALTLLMFAPDANAACTPAAANNVIATCTGVSAGPYGSGTETGVNITVAAGASVVSGGSSAINVSDGTFVVEAGASVVAVDTAIRAGNGTAFVTNSGSITGTTTYGVFGSTNATVTNNAGASITGGLDGVFANTNMTVANAAGASIVGGQYALRSGGTANITNAGSITSQAHSPVSAAISIENGANVVNGATGSITGGRFGILSTLGALDVTNSGIIIGAYGGSGYGISGQNGVTVTNNAGARIAGEQYGIFSGAGGSSVVNAGTITGGTAAIMFSGSGNTLTLLPSSVISGNVLGAGSDTIQLGGAGAATFDASQLGAAAQYQGFGTANKIGSSAWTLTGSGTFAGRVNVNDGTLSVNGNLSSASILTVNAGGTLGGNGIVGATLINGGTLAPGNSIGTLTMSSLTLTAASTYLVQVSGAGADKTIVTGAANLAGKVVVDPPTRLSVSTTYTILTAGTVSGAFSGAESAANFVRNARLSYVGNDVLLTLDPGLLSPALPGYASINQKNVAAAIDNGLAGGAATPAAINALFGLSGDPLRNALTQVSGETAIGSQQTTFNAMNLFLGVVTDPFLAGRDGAGFPSAAAAGYAAEDSAARGYAATGRKRLAAEREAYAAIYRKAPVAQAYAPSWSVWASGFGGAQTTDGNTALGSNSTTSRIAGGTAGADYWFSPYTVAGFALAGGGTSFSVTNGGTGRSDLFQAGAFVRHNAGPAYITGALAYGWQDITTDRIVTIAGADHLRARFNANAYSGRAEGGYRLVAPWSADVGLTPYVAGQFTTFDLPAYAESAIFGTNGFALSYASKSVTATRSELGLRADTSFLLDDAILTLRGRAAWAHDFNADRNIAATFQALPGASFVVNGAAQAQNAALTTASAELKWRNGWSAAATFEGEFSDITRSFAGKGGVRYVW